MNSIDGVEIIYRPFVEKDIPLIMHSWASSYYEGCPTHDLTREKFHYLHRPIREKFIARKKAQVTVCCPKDDPWHITGWIASEPIKADILIHYVYVKNLFRNKGIGRALIATVVQPCFSQIYFSHRTYKSNEIMEKYPDQFYLYKFLPNVVI